jgi:hypothetical protein
MLKKILTRTTLVLAIVAFTATGAFAQQYYNNGYYNAPPNTYSNNGYYNNYAYQPVYTPNYGYAQPNYSQNYGYTQPVYDPYNNSYYYPNDRNSTVKKALTYGALGAGAGYLLSKDGNRTKNALVGAGIGAAMSLMLNKF